MKRILFLLAAFASMAVACQVEDVNEAQTPAGETFTIEAAIVPSTKTSLTITEDAYKVEWDAEDALSVVAKYADGSYAGYEFVKTGDNTFANETVENPSELTELNVLYPYDDYLKSIDEDGEFNGYTYIGSRSDDSQIQTGVNNTEHVNAPLYGYAVLADETPVVEMKHASTLFEIIVKNESGVDLVVSNVALSNSENKNLVGTFYINPQTGALSEGQYVASTISLDVNNGNIAAGETGRFYITSAPFELAANSTLDITVTANGEASHIAKTISEATTFEAGKVNHINVSIEEAAEIEPVLPMEVPGSVSFIQGSVNPEYVTVNQNDERYADGALKLDKTDESVVVYVNAAVGSIELTAKYNGNTTSTLDILGSVDGVEYDLIETIGSENGIGTAKSSCETSALINSGYRYFKFNMKKDSGNFSIYEIKFNEEITDPFISIENTSLEFAYNDAISGTLSYSILNASYDDVTVSCDESLNGWFTAEKSADGVISYTVAANEGPERAGNITISVAGGNSIVVKVSQTAKPAEGTITDVVTVALFNLGSGYSDFSGVSVTSDAVYAGNAMKNGANIQMRCSDSDEDPSGIITTESGGKVKTISVKWASTTAEGRTLNIYGSNTPYASAGDLYSDSVTPIATIVKGEGKPVSVEIDADYSYIGFRSNSRTMYLEQIEIVWDTVE